MGISANTLRIALQNGEFREFGRAIVTTPEDKSKTGKPRYTYFLNEVAFRKFMKGDNLEKVMDWFNTVTANDTLPNN